MTLLKLIIFTSVINNKVTNKELPWRQVGNVLQLPVVHVTVPEADRLYPVAQVIVAVLPEVWGVALYVGVLLLAIVPISLQSEIKYNIITVLFT